MHTFARSLFVAPLLLSVGCKEYFSVDEACHPKGTFRGDNQVSGADLDAINRWNCHRRLVGFERAGVSEESQAVAVNVVDYIAANPDVYRGYFTGLSDATAFLNQEPARPEFSGVTVYERLDTADYPIVSAQGTWTFELIGIYADDGRSGADIVDSWFDVYWAQEFGLTPSVFDVGYHEQDLGADWWASALEASGVVTPVNPVPTSGKAFYALVVSQAPPIEGAGEEPVTYPKRDQIDVPTTGIIALDRTTPDANNNGTLEDDIIQLSFPISVGQISASATGTTVSTAANPYGMDIIAASIVAGNGEVLETIWVDPQEAEPTNHTLTVTGGFNFWMGSLMATKPFEPMSPYTVYVDYQSVDGPNSYTFSFTTGADDPGATARVARGTGARSADLRVVGTPLVAPTR